MGMLDAARLASIAQQMLINGASGRAFQGQINQQLRGSAGNSAHGWELMLQLAFCTAKVKRVMSS